MTGGVFGGGVIFVVAALLWVAVLVPSWMRRREFKAAEQNALRLQRTLRVLAETAEVPSEVRVEATAREALAQERMLRTAQREQEAERKAKLAEARAAQLRAEMRAQQMKRKQAALVRAAKLRRPWVRRVRSSVALVSLLALIAAFVGIGTAIAGLGSAVLIAGAAVFVASLAVLVMLAPGRAKLVEIPAEELSTAVAAKPSAVATETTSTEADGRAAAAHAAAQAAAAARIDRAKAMARARAERSSQLQVQNQGDSMLLTTVAEDAGQGSARRAAAVQQTRQQVSDEDHATDSATIVDSETAGQAAASPARATRVPAPSRLSEMGVVGDTSDGALDLDSVLRNRRAG